MRPDRTGAMKRSNKRRGKAPTPTPTLAPPTHAPQEREAGLRQAEDRHEGQENYGGEHGGRGRRALYREELESGYGPRDEGAGEVAHGEDGLPPAAEGEGEGNEHAPDDALGLYLRQMGAIPLLDRPQEVALAERLERHRRRY